jgi:hypothetical protein
MSIPEDCQHRGKFKKKCCEVIWEGVITDHDECVDSKGCDIIAYNDYFFFIIEIKEGNISSGDAKKAIEQIKWCESFYAQYIGHRKKFRLFLHCVSDRKRRLDSYARYKFKHEKIIVKECKNKYNLSDLLP